MRRNSGVIGSKTKLMGQAPSQVITDTDDGVGEGLR